MLGEQSSDVEFILSREDVQQAHRETGGRHG
jgi:glycerol-3-phosphate dehydrogenase (NAD(P)+)